MGLIQCVVKKRRCKSHVAQITSIEANFPSIKTMNFSLCVGFPRADPFDFFIDLAKATPPWSKSASDFCSPLS
jgi:hypothetical protein